MTNILPPREFNEHRHGEPNLDDWRRLQPDGSGILLDPATTQPLKPGRPHEWLDADGRLGEGYVLLGRYGTNIQLTIAYGGHSAADHLGASQWFEEKIAQADAYAREEAGWQREAYDKSFHDFAAFGKLPRFVDGFGERIWRAIAKTGTTNFSVDIEDTGRPLDDFLLDMHQDLMEFDLEAQARSAQGMLREGQYAAFHHWSVALSAMREWYMIGKLGYELKPQLAEERALQILLTAGLYHRDLTRKLRLFGLQVFPKIINPSAINRTDPRALRDTRIQEALASGIIR